MKKLLIANRGEIAIRISQAAADYGINSVAVFSSDDTESLHVARADEAVALHGSGAAAYLDRQQILAAAVETGADAVHPGYGFLSENAEFAHACNEAGLQFIGPAPEVLEQFGNKLLARSLARDNEVPVAAGSFAATTLKDARRLFEEIEGGVMLKAVAGGGGRGMRAVRSASELEEAWNRCRSEAATAFGNDAVYVEQLLPAGRHIEVQIVGNGDRVVAIGERDCSLQRRHQKVLEIAPAPGLPEACRKLLYEYACTLGNAVNYRGIGTVEFMLWDDWQKIAFIEVNPRLQVEHTITEATTGLDLVQTQLSLVDGDTLAALQMTVTPPSHGMAVQARVCMEKMQGDCSALASGGTLTAFELPSGPRVRVDHCGYAGYTTSPRFDSLLAKVITHTLPSANSTSEAVAFAEALQANYRALCEFRIAGVDSNLAFLKNLLRHPSIAANRFDTGFIEREINALITVDDHPQNYVSSRNAAIPVKHVVGDEGPADSTPLTAQMQGTVISLSVSAGDAMSAGQELLVMDSMKLEHVITAPVSGHVVKLVVEEGDTVFAGHPLLHYAEDKNAEAAVSTQQAIDLDSIRPDLQQVIALHAYTLDENRQDKIAKLHARGKQSARENIAQLTAGGDFIEYGALAIASQRSRRDVDDLRRNTPADGLVTGVGEINREFFVADAARAAILAYDYSVLAGTQGFFNHAKTDRMIEVIEKTPMPMVFFAEGGGGRPGDVDAQLMGSTGLTCSSFGAMARLSGKVPIVGINAGYCFAGNAAFLGLCDVIIATRESRLGMGGPAMIEGGGLGVVDKNDIGPSEVQVANGTIDILAESETDAVAKARQYLSYFQGRISDWSANDQRLLRHAVPEHRNRAFDMHNIIETLADTGSVLELRPDHAPGYITALARVEGESLAILANNNGVISGAIDAKCSRKADRFLKLCEQFKLRVLYLVDTPGLMVGPDYDAEGTARAAGDFYITSSRLTVPTGAIIVRKAYGLGAMAAMGGSSRASSFCISWPTGEMGPMGIEGSIRLGFRKELEAIEDPDAREKTFKAMVLQAWEDTRAIHGASTVEIDAVIDPQESRRWISTMLKK